ncbi:unnamed protein product, partial [Penicillium manginii]
GKEKPDLQAQDEPDPLPDAADRPRPTFSTQAGTTAHDDAVHRFSGDLTAWYLCPSLGLIATRTGMAAWAS